MKFRILHYKGVYTVQRRIFGIWMSWVDRAYDSYKEAFEHIQRRTGEIK